jgi:hypothetical protein
MDEIEEFCKYLTGSVNRRLLTLFSRVLELPDDYLWDNVQSHDGPTGEGYFRHALFRPVKKQTQEASKGLRMHGHTDFGLTTLLFSVPISCLQIWGKDEQWYYVPYKPGALVINIGDTLEIVSGGHFKATRHRVFKPPVDQLEQERLSLVPAQGKSNYSLLLTRTLTTPDRITFDPARRLRRGPRRVLGVQEAHTAGRTSSYQPSMARDSDRYSDGSNGYCAQPCWCAPGDHRWEAYAPARVHGSEGRFACLRMQYVEHISTYFITNQALFLFHNR